eukprot:jgi/Botrbrau1/5892/Bobra.0366s0070.1
MAGPIGSPQPWWFRNLLRSPYAFSSAELEAQYQVFQATKLNLWTLGNAMFTVIGWMSLVYKILGPGKQFQHVLPSPLVPVLFHFLPSVAVLALLSLHPQLYIKHKRIIHAAILLGISVGTQRAREIFLWMKLVDNPSCSNTKWAQQLGYFSSENLYLSMMWSYVRAFSVGPLADVVIMTVGVCVQMAGNREFCRFPLLGPSPVTLTPKVLAVTQWASDSLLSLVSFVYPVQAMPLGCAAALGFWQAMGWLLACLSVMVSEVLSRRAFLRTITASTIIGPEYATAALAWPIGRAFMIVNSLGWVFTLCLMQSAIWAVALPIVS